MASLIILDRARELARPGSAIGSGGYWQRVLDAASARVRAITGRLLAAANYSETGSTVESEDADGTTRHVYYLGEPTGTAIPFVSFTTLKLGGAALATTDVRIEAVRLVFSAPGRVEAAYPGGYMQTGSTALAVIEGAVVDCMEIEHQLLGGAIDVTGLSIEQRLEPIVAALLPYTRMMAPGLSYQFGPGD